MSSSPHFLDPTTSSETTSTGQLGHGFTLIAGPGSLQNHKIKCRQDAEDEDLRSQG